MIEGNPIKGQSSEKRLRLAIKALNGDGSYKGRSILDDEWALFEMATEHLKDWLSFQQSEEWSGNERIKNRKPRIRSNNKLAECIVERSERHSLRDIKRLRETFGAKRYEILCEHYELAESPNLNERILKILNLLDEIGIKSSTDYLPRADLELWKKIKNHEQVFEFADKRSD